MYFFCLKLRSDVYDQFVNADQVAGVKVCVTIMIMITFTINENIISNINLM